jgi:acetoin:2,6-dichlorophenolindophenol oxidoreductase subunit alpha
MMSDMDHLRIYRTMCMIRAFEEQVYKAVEDGKVTCQVYMSAGHESIPATIAPHFPDAWVLSQHRGHGNYLAFGGDPKALRDELLGHHSGCTKGMGGSPCIQDRSKKIIGHCGLIGDHVPIATGIAYARREPVVCFFGDGAAEEDYMLPAIGFAVTHQLPVLFVCEDNNLSVLTEKKVRRSWNFAEVVRGFRDIWVEELDDDPTGIDAELRFLLREKALPALLSIEVTRHYWHVGAGTDGEPPYDVLESFYEDLKEEGYTANKLDTIRIEEQSSMEKLWQSGM